LQGFLIHFRRLSPARTPLKGNPTKEKMYSATSAESPVKTLVVTPYSLKMGQSLGRALFGWVEENQITDQNHVLFVVGAENAPTAEGLFF
jgi:hypothetical protein